MSRCVIIDILNQSMAALMKKLIATSLSIVLLVSGCGGDNRSNKQRCLDGNTEANPTKYSWTPETGTLDSYLFPDDAGTCNVKVGIRG